MTAGHNRREQRLSPWRRHPRQLQAGLSRPVSNRPADAPGRRHLAWALAATATLIALQAGLQRPVRAAAWKDCAFNDRPLPCRDHHFADGSVRIVWQDGPAMTYRLIQPGFPVSILRDGLGGRWQRQILPQGNAVFLNPANGNRIVVPLR